MSFLVISNTRNQIPIFLCFPFSQKPSGADVCLLLREQRSGQQGVLGNWADSKGEEIFRIYGWQTGASFQSYNVPSPRWREVSGVISQPGSITTALASPQAGSNAVPTVLLLRLTSAPDLEALTTNASLQLFGLTSRRKRKPQIGSQKEENEGWG